MSSRLAHECEVAASRARSLQIAGFRYAIEGDTVVLDGDALWPEAVDSVAKVFTATSARAVDNRVRVVAPDPERPGGIRSPDGFVHVVNLGQDAARLAETVNWEVAPGDTLASIAEAVYGDATLTERIANANRNQIGAGGFIRAGQRLRIPPR